MVHLGPFEPAPCLAAAVSGGADSTALALLADAWARQRGGSVVALVVDHTLRPESATEAAVTADRLTARGIAVRQFRAEGLTRGPAVAERARAARYRLLTDACAEAGILHLLLGHHAADQAETLMIRALGQSANRGLAAMPALTETTSLRLLRPLLGILPEHLRQFLIRAGLPWIEDPSNRDPHALRARLRALRSDRDLPAGTRALCDAAASAGKQRAARERAIAAELARGVTVRPEGFAVLCPGPIAADAMAAVIQTIGGAPYPPPPAQIVGLAAHPRPATVAGVRLLPAGRLGPGLLVVREEAAMARAVPAQSGAVWDGRFRLAAGASPPAGAEIGPLGDDAATLRGRSDLPSAVLRTLPAVRCGKKLVAVPHLLYSGLIAWERVRLIPNPPRSLAGAPFLIAPHSH
jgi:tRNA(Ile)-lysidine synthase